MLLDLNRPVRDLLDDLCRLVGSGRRSGRDGRLSRLVLDDDLLTAGCATTCQGVSSRGGGRYDVCVLNLDLLNLIAAEIA